MMGIKKEMRWLAILFSVLVFPVAAISAQELSPQEIIDRFSTKESEFRNVWERYTYTQKILFEVLGPDREPRERREVIFEVFFTKDGKRQTRKVSDRGGLRSVGVTQEDFENALSLQPFVLTREELPHYDVEYQGKERVDELDTYVFEVEPKKKKKGKRYFKGRLWVDTQDLQVVMLKGEIVPQSSDNQFPKFETVREQIDGEYWFPTWTLADDVLHFPRSRPVHIREIITYEDYKKFDVGTSIKYGPVEEKPNQP